MATLNTKQLITDVDKLKTEVKELTEQLIKLKNGFKDTADAEEKSSKQIKDLERDIVKAATAAQKLATAEDKLAAAKLKDAKAATELAKKTDIEAKAQERAAKETEKAAKEKQKLEEKTKKAEKAANKAGKVYREQSATLNELRNQAKDLALTLGEDSEEFKKVAKEVNELDERLKGVDKSLGQSQRSVGEYEKGWQGVGKKGAQAFLSIGTALKAAGIGIVLAIVTAIVDQFKKLDPIVDFVAEKLGQLKAIVEVIIGGIAGFFKNLISGTDEATSSFDDLGKKIKEAAERAKEIAQLEVAIRKLNLQLAKTIPNLEAQANAYNRIADDATLSLKVQEEAAILAANSNRRLAFETRKVAIEEAKLLAKRIEQAKASGFINDELRLQYAQAQAAVTQANDNIAQVEFENAQRIRQIRQDAAEQDLDFQIDGAIKRRELLIRQAEDEKLTQEQRLEALRQLTELMDQSLSDQVELLQGFATEQITINELVNESNAKALAVRVQEFGLSEILTNRLLEVIKERQAAEIEAFDIRKAISEKDKEIRQNEFEEEIAELEALSEADLAAYEEEERLNLLRIESAEKVKDAQISFNQELADSENELLQAKIGAAMTGVDILRQAAGESSAIAKAAYLFQQGLAVASIVKDTEVANAAVTAKYALVPGGELIAAAIKNTNKINAAAGIAAIFASTIGEFAFADGVIDFQGKGTGTSDSNLALISHGESVIKAKSTAKAPKLLTGINNGVITDDVIPSITGMRAIESQQQQIIFDTRKMENEMRDVKNLLANQMYILPKEGYNLMDRKMNRINYH